MGAKNQRLVEQHEFSKVVCEFSVFPVLYVFTIWEARNRAIFKNTWTPIDISSALLLQKVQEHRKAHKEGKTRAIITPVIDRSIPWDFFDGASQGDLAIGRAGGVIFILETNKTSFKLGL